MRILLMGFLFSLFSKSSDAQPIPKSIYDFKIKALDESVINFASFKGKKILIVNTASKCGYTPQYKNLEALHQRYKDQLVIVGFPANNFLWQEPGDNATIAEFCQKNYGVSFVMAAKISVKGNDMAPIYQWLTQKKYNHNSNSSVKWNFQKYLIDEKGNLIQMFSPGVDPLDAAIIQAIEK
jgi:glutathione peroxidase